MRGFTHGYLDGPDHQKLVHGRFPKSRGIHVGTVIDATDDSVMIELRAGNSLKPGDGIVFDEGHPEQDEQGGRVYTVEPCAGIGRGSKPAVVEVTFGRGVINFVALNIGSMVWKTDDPAVRRRLEQSFARDQVVRRVPLGVRVAAKVGQPLRLTVWDDAGHETTVFTDQPLQQAQKHPLSEQLLRDQFGRLGQTPFELGVIEWESADPVMVPKSVLNDLRRRAVETLVAARDGELRYRMEEADALEHVR